MKAINLLRKTRRGQLQIAETLVSVSLMLILALLLINAANQTNISDRDLTSLQNTASDILITADDTGILRPVIYLRNSIEYQSEYLESVDILNELIKATLSNRIGFVLRMRQVANQIVENEYIYLLGSHADVIALQKGGEGTQAFYFVGSFTSSDYGTFFDNYLVELYVWEKI
ncbi:MAG: hypothetical protein ACXACP_01370 [Candidatus Hodarchaeales archaeon]|jgi:hypothetical protein